MTRDEKIERQGFESVSGPAYGRYGDHRDNPYRVGSRDYLTFEDGQKSARDEARKEPGR